MARTRKTQYCTLLNTDDVNEALRSMGDYDRRIEAINASMQLKIDAIKAEHEAMAKPLMEARAGLETQVGLYAEARRAEFKTTRTKVLTFGEFGFRQSTKAQCPKSPDAVADVIAMMRKAGMEDCIKVTPASINRAVLRTYDAAKVKAVGCELVVKDTFFCEPYREQLPEV